MQDIFLDKEKIRTMQRDIKEAEGISVYPKSDEAKEITQSFIAEKKEETAPAIEPIIEQVAPLMTAESSVEDEAKRAEDLAYKLAISSNESGENVKEKVMEEAETKPATEAAPVTFMNPEKKEEPEEEIPEPEIQPVAVAPETLPVEEMIAPKPAAKPVVEERIPSARELGLEEPEKIPSAKDLGLEGPDQIKEMEEELKKVDEDEEKLLKISEQTFELEESLKGINEEKAPFESRKNEIEEEINNIKKKLDLILERKNKTDEIKKELEAKEALAQTPEEKRAVEKERWRVEDERDKIEKEKYDKEDEIKSLRLQIRECELNAEKVIAKEKETLQQLEVLRRDRDRIILAQTKKDLEMRLKPLNQEVENIKKEMFENTKLRDKSDKALTDIGLREKAVEDEIKILERRQGETTDEVILRDIESRRRTAEENRRKLEKDRWEIEDKLKDMDETRKIIKEKYQEVAAQIKQIKDELLQIEEKIK